MKTKLSIVIIDDDKSLSYSIRDQLSKDDSFEIVGIAHDGQEGIELIKNQKPDIVLLDMVMPKVDGLAILETYGKSSVQFIVLSAIGHDLITRRAMSLGAVYYLIKPFDIKSIPDRLKSLFLGEKIKDNAHKYLDLPHLETVVLEEIQSLSIPMHVKGYHYIKEAVVLICKMNAENIKITKEIYPQIASTYGTTPSSVERAIRNAIEITINRNEELVYSYFSKEIFNHKITNKEFLYKIVTGVKKKV